MTNAKGLGSPIKQPDESTNRKEITPETTGINHTRPPDDPHPEWKQAGSEKTYSQGNAGIVLGTDRTGIKTTKTFHTGEAAGKTVQMDSGYGALGHDGTYMIDLVAGRNSYYNINKSDDKQVAVVAPNFKADAARIYISQKTDADKNFGLTPGRVGQTPGRAAIVMKADGIRIIGRSGVKIVTGVGLGDARKNSKGGPLGSIKGIDLIAGNLDSGDVSLQPIPLGLNLVQCLAEMLDTQKFTLHLIKKLMGTIGDINQDFYSHIHLAEWFFGAPVGLSPSLQVAQGIHKASLEAAKQELQFASMNLSNTEMSFLSSASKTYICSSFNHTN
jgi:hypothetical protein